MPKLNDPQRGQPIDYSFLSTITSSINSLWDIVSGSKKSHLKLLNSSAQNMDLPTSYLLFSAGVVEVNDPTIKPKQTIQFSFTFQTPFSQIPVVTATVNTSGNAVAKDAYAVITSVDAKKVDGYVVFFNSGKANARVNIIAIGN